MIRKYINIKVVVILIFLISEHNVMAMDWLSSMYRSGRNVANFLMARPLDSGVQKVEQKVPTSSVRLVTIEDPTYMAALMNWFSGRRSNAVGVNGASIDRPNGSGVLPATSVASSSSSSSSSERREEDPKSSSFSGSGVFPQKVNLSFGKKYLDDRDDDQTSSMIVLTPEERSTGASSNSSSSSPTQTPFMELWEVMERIENSQEKFLVESTLKLFRKINFESQQKIKQEINKRPLTVNQTESSDYRKYKDEIQRFGLNLPLKELAD